MTTASTRLAVLSAVLSLAAALLSCSAASLSNGSARRRYCTGMPEPKLQIGVIMADGWPYYSLANLGTSPGTSAISFEGQARWSGFWIPGPRSAEGINVGSDATHYPRATEATVESVTALGILEPWALVEFEANCGDPPSGQSLFMTSMRRLDGTAQFPVRLTELVERLLARNDELIAAKQAGVGAMLAEQAKAAFVLRPGVEDPYLLDRAVISTMPFLYWRDDHLQVELRNSLEVAEMGNGCGNEPADGGPCQSMSARVVVEQVVRFTVDRKGRIVAEQVATPTARAESFPPPQ